MPYKIAQDLPELSLSAGDELEYKQGELPCRYKFTAVWVEQEKPKPKPKAKKKD